jgi:dipeptidyl aminopeptidase/acylaminoacyl peptidase
MPNFRSSAGYGTAFMLRRRADWGGQDWRDVETGVDSLVRAGLADPDRLGIFGGSYGGYLTAWAITQTHRFKAAYMDRSISNLPALWGQSDTHRYRAWDFGGRPWEAFGPMWERSPIAHVANARTPTLITVGDNDARTPIAQSKELYESLKSLGVPTEFVHYPREGHPLREPRHRSDALQRALAWFDRWIR